MPIRRITFDMNLSQEEDDLLADLLGDQPNLDAVLSRHARAALGEYVEVYLGRRSSSRGADIQELRLALLVEFAFGGRIPNEATVGALLKTPPSGSRTLIRNTISRYRHQLDAAMTGSAKAVLEEVVWSGDAVYTHRASSNMVELLNQRLLALDPTLKPVGRVSGSAGTWIIDEDVYADLCEAFGANPVPKP
jgi:hypothetical protein